MTKPNFLIVASIPRFDDRDCICGWRTQLVETAETYGWATRRLAAIWERDELALSEIGLEVIDTRTGKRAVRPLSPEAIEIAFEQDGEIPF
jgi:hypothetical protein